MNLRCEACSTVWAGPYEGENVAQFLATFRDSVCPHCNGASGQMFWTRTPAGETYVPPEERQVLAVGGDPGEAPAEATVLAGPEQPEAPPA